MTRAARVAGPLLAFFIAWGPHGWEGPGDGRGLSALAMCAWMLTWWLTECVPVAVTACIPLLWVPLAGALPSRGWALARDTVVPYLDGYIILFMGGMVLGAAMQQVGLHRRIALHIMARVGTSASRLVLGVLLSTAVISTGLSNTATAVMMVPIAMALVTRLEEDSPAGRLPFLAAALLMAVAWGANIGGMATKIGTGTNSIFAGHAARVMGRDVGFLKFMVLAVPLVVVMVPLAWMVLWRHAAREAVPVSAAADLVRRELAAMGTLSRDEKRVAACCGAAALLWVTADLVRPALFAWLQPLLPGVKLLPKHHEAAVGVACALAVVLLGGAGWTQVKKQPWDMLLLLGGSFAMAGVLESSGVNEVLAARLAPVAEWPAPAQFLVVSAAAVVISAVASNTATINLLLAVLPARLPLLFSATMASSLDFALPAGTPPNAVVFGTGRVSFRAMLGTGIQLDAWAALACALHGWRWVLPLVG